MSARAYRVAPRRRSADGRRAASTGTGSAGCSWSWSCSGSWSPTCSPAISFVDAWRGSHAERSELQSLSEEHTRLVAKAASLNKPGAASEQARRHGHGRAGRARLRDQGLASLTLQRVSGQPGERGAGRHHTPRRASGRSSAGAYLAGAVELAVVLAALAFGAYRVGPLLLPGLGGRPGAPGRDGARGESGWSASPRRVGTFGGFERGPVLAGDGRGRPRRRD